MLKRAKRRGEPTHNHRDWPINARQGAKDREHNRVISAHSNEARMFFSVFGEAVDSADFGRGVHPRWGDERVIGDLQLVDSEEGVVGGPVV